VLVALGRVSVGDWTEQVAALVPDVGRISA